jgi:DNA-binding beta-propeller fold protein YncE
MNMRAKLVLALCAAMLLGTAPHRHASASGSFKIDVPSGPFISGSRINIGAAGVDGPVAFSVLGPGRIEAGQYVAPAVSTPETSTLIGSAHGAIAMKSVRIVPAPSADEPLLAVATYHSGIALHDPRTFKLIGYVPIGGAPGDVAFTRNGGIVAPDTDGDALAIVQRAPWSLRIIRNVVLGNEVAADPANADIFVSDRDAAGFGALSKISPDGSVVRVKTGVTAEGLAIDERRNVVYVGNVNDNSVAVVDARTMRVVRRIASVQRTFGIALDSNGRRLYVVSNTSPSMPYRGGYVAAISLAPRLPRIVERSARMTFPIGIAFDGRANRLFVTDEAADSVYVLNARTLHALRKPLPTCDTPWRPHIAAGRLYVPCANADEVDVFDLRTLRRVHGAPFRTGGFPLSVALWP